MFGSMIRTLYKIVLQMAQITLIAHAVQVVTILSNRFHSITYARAYSGKGVFLGD